MKIRGGFLILDHWRFSKLRVGLGIKRILGSGHILGTWWNLTVVAHHISTGVNKLECLLDVQHKDIQWAKWVWCGRRRKCNNCLGIATWGCNQKFLYRRKLTYLFGLRNSNINCFLQSWKDAWGSRRFSVNICAPLLLLYTWLYLRGWGN